MISWVIVGVLLVGYPVFWLERRRNTKRVFERGHQVLIQQISDARTQLDAARESEHRHKLKITDVLNERDQWVTLYYDQSIGHGNAQSLMMNLINNLGAALKKAGFKFEIPGGILAMRQEFQEVHEEPARRAQELLELAKQNQKANQLSP